MQAAIERLAQAAGQGSRLPAKIREDSAMLAAQLAVIQSATRCLKEFSAIPAPRLQLVDVSDLMARILQELDGPLRAAAPAVRSEVVLERDLPKVMADPELLHRVLHGLVLNGLEAMPEGGVLRVQTGRSEAGVAIGVSDSGRGWSPEELRRLFLDGNSKEPEGAGWGIAVVQAVVSDVRGYATVESAVGKGTRASIELPRAAAAGS
jgi:C4-dicarboxylate-specific signal transduction histidine kinase